MRNTTVQNIETNKICTKALVIEKPKEGFYGTHKFVVKNDSGKILIKTKSKSSVPAIGDYVYIEGNFQEPRIDNQFDEKKYLRSQGIKAKISSAEIIQTKASNSLEASFLKLVSNIQSSFLLIHKSILNTDESAIMRKILVGRASGERIDTELYYAIQNLGVSHLFAASGLHLTTFCLFLFYVCGLFKLSKKKRVLFTILGITFYSTIAAWSPSITRAWFIATVALMGQLSNRKINLLSTLLIALFLSLLIDPNSIGDIGLQFSYLAVLGIVLWAEKLTNKMIFIPRSWADPIAVTVSAQILILPLQIYYFHNIPIYFLIANIVAIPITGLILLSGLLTSFISVFGSIGWFIASTIEIFTSIFIKLLSVWLLLLNKLPAADLKIESLPFVWMIWLYIAVIGYAFLWRSKVAKHLVAASFLFLVSTSLLANSQNIEVQSLSRRWYEATYIKLPSKQTLLICNQSMDYLDTDKLLRDLRQASITKVDWWIGFCKKPDALEAKRIIVPEGKTTHSISKDFKLITNEDAVLVDYKDFSGLVLFKPLMTTDSETFYSYIKFAFPKDISRRTLWSQMPRAQFCGLPHLSKKQRLETERLLEKSCGEIAGDFDIDLNKYKTKRSFPQEFNLAK